MADAEAEPLTVKEIPTSVGEVFRDAAIPGLDSKEAIDQGLRQQKNILAETAALYVALRELPEGAEVTVVHDFVGFGDWMEGRSRAPKDPSLRAVVSACVKLVEEKGLKLVYLHQPGHRSTWAGRHDLARFNKRADELASEGSTLKGS